MFVQDVELERIATLGLEQAIQAYRSVVAEHPNSAFVGDSLMGIAKIYEENLQDLDGAAAAYKELISYFPQAVLAREARAVMARFEVQLKNHPARRHGFVEDSTGR